MKKIRKMRSRYILNTEIRTNIFVVNLMFIFALLRVSYGEGMDGDFGSGSSSSSSSSVGVTSSRRTYQNLVNQKIKKFGEETARYAISFIPATVEFSEVHYPNNTTMAATAVVDMMSHIRDPFKHGVTAAVLAGLYIAALISLIIFAITGTVAFICSFSDCRNFFLGVKPEARPFGGGTSSQIFKKRDNSHRWDEMQPAIQALHNSFDKYEGNPML